MGCERYEPHLTAYLDGIHTVMVNAGFGRLVTDTKNIFDLNHDGTLDTNFNGALEMLGNESTSDSARNLINGVIGFSSGLAPRLEVLDLADQLATAFVQLQQAVDIDLHGLVAAGFAEPVGVFAQQSVVKHFASL